MLLCETSGILCLTCRQWTLIKWTTWTVTVAWALTAHTALPAAGHHSLPLHLQQQRPISDAHISGGLRSHAADDVQDDSDYEEDEKAAALGPQIPPPDHDDYYGKGWQPPKPRDQAARLADCAAGKAALCSGFTHAGSA